MESQPSHLSPDIIDPRWANLDEETQEAALQLRRHVTTAVAPLTSIPEDLLFLERRELYDPNEAFTAPGTPWAIQDRGTIAQNLLLATLQKLYGMQDAIQAFWLRYGNPEVYRKNDGTKTGILDLMIEESYADYLINRFAFPIHIEGEENKHYGPDIYWIRCLVDPVDGTEASDRRKLHWSMCFCFREPTPPFCAPNDDTELASLIFQPMTGAGVYSIANRVAFYNNRPIVRPFPTARSLLEVPDKLSIEYKIPNRLGALALNSAFDQELRRCMEASGARLRDTLGSFNYEIATVSLGCTDAVVYIGNEAFTDLDLFASGLAIAAAAKVVIQARKTGDAIVLTVSANRGVDHLIWKNLKQAGLDINSSEQLLPIPH